MIVRIICWLISSVIAGFLLEDWRKTRNPFTLTFASAFMATGSIYIYQVIVRYL